MGLESRLAPHLSALLEVLAARRRQLRLRIGMAVVIGLCCLPAVGWAFALGWVATYLALQVFETLWMQRARSPLQILALLHANGWVFGAFALSGPYVTGPWGLAGAVAMLAGALTNTALSNQRSTIGFVVAATPFAVYLAALPVMGFQLGGDANQLIVLVLTSALLVAATIMLWRSSSRALAAESEARARAEAADAAKSAFVAMVSHELRTPISAILAGAEAIDARQPPAAQQANKQLIVDAARMMRFLLNDLLDHAKLEAGRMSIEETVFDLRRLVRDTVRFWRPEARARGLRLGLSGARSLPQWVASDPTRIRQVLNNLFSNGLKFTEHGHVALEIAVAPAADGAFTLTLTVADTGAGMTDAQAERLFRPFAQADATIARTHGGTGLGLTISRDLARLMGGDLTVTTAIGRGSSFAFRFEARPAEAPADTGTAETPAVAERGLHILVADDHDVNRRAFNLLLTPIADRVVAVADGVEAVEAATLEPFDVVLLDLNMPRMGGLEAAARLREAHGAGLPIIALTASVGPEDVAACRAAGMDGFVGKPVEAEELYRVIGEVLAAADDPTERAVA